jgi:hypothetical protein
MTDEEILQKMREWVNKSIAYAMESSGDAWMHTLGDMAQIFLQLQIIKRLDSIDDTLIVIMKQTDKEPY